MELKRHAAIYLWLAVTLVSAGGASCPWTRKQLVQPAPIAFESRPTLQQVIQTVNDNSQKVQRLQTDDASLTIQGVPSLRTNLAFERPQNFRMRASFTGVGQVLDLGSNREMFWALVDAPEMLTGIPKAVYYARHDQMRNFAGNSPIPVRPDLVTDAFGLVYLDPGGRHDGPYRRAAGQLEIRSPVPTADGDLMKVTIVDETYGWVLEQHLYDPRGQPLVSAVSAEHRYYPLVDASLPHRVTITLPPPGRPLEIEVGEYSINQTGGDAPQLFTMPAYEGYPLVDLGRVNAPSPGNGFPSRDTGNNDQSPGFGRRAAPVSSPRRNNDSSSRSGLRPPVARFFR